MALEIVRDAKDNTIDVTRITSIIILIAYYLIVRNLLFLSTCNDQVGIYESSRGIISGVFYALFRATGKKKAVDYICTERRCKEISIYNLISVTSIQSACNIRAQEYIPHPDYIYGYNLANCAVYRI